MMTDNWRVYATFMFIGVVLGVMVSVVVIGQGQGRRDATIAALRDRTGELERELDAAQDLVRRTEDANRRINERQQRIADAVDSAGRRLAAASATNNDIIELVDISLGLLDELQGVLNAGDSPVAP